MQFICSTYDVPYRMKDTHNTPLVRAAELRNASLDMRSTLIIALPIARTSAIMNQSSQFDGLKTQLLKLPMFSRAKAWIISRTKKYPPPAMIA